MHFASCSRFRRERTGAHRSICSWLRCEGDALRSLCDKVEIEGDLRLLLAALGVLPDTVVDPVLIAAALLGMFDNSRARTAFRTRWRVPADRIAALIETLRVSIFSWAVGAWRRIALL